MNDERSFERTARAWLELGANQAPDRTVQSVLLAIETTPQERDVRIPWRFPTMSTPLRVGAAAVIGLLLLGAGIYLFGGSSPGIGGPAASNPPATFDAPTASRILTRLDALQGLYASGDAAGIGAWSSEESAWADEHLAGLPTQAVEVSAYLANVRALRSAVDAGRDLNDGVVALLAMRETIAEAVGLPTPP